MYCLTVKVTVPVLIEQDEGLLTGVPEIVQLVSAGGPVAKFVSVAVINVPGMRESG